MGKKIHLTESQLRDMITEAVIREVDVQGDFDSAKKVRGNWNGENKPMNGNNKYYPWVGKENTPEDAELFKSNSVKNGKVPECLEKILSSNGWERVGYGTGTGKAVPEGMFFITIAPIDFDKSRMFSEFSGEIRNCIPGVTSSRGKSGLVYLIIPETESNEINESMFKKIGNKISNFLSGPNNRGLKKFLIDNGWDYVWNDTIKGDHYFEMNIFEKPSSMNSCGFKELLNRINNEYFRSNGVNARATVGSEIENADYCYPLRIEY